MRPTIDYRHQYNDHYSLRLPTTCCLAHAHYYHAPLTIAVTDTSTNYLLATYYLLLSSPTALATYAHPRSPHLNVGGLGLGVRRGVPVARPHTPDLEPATDSAARHAMHVVTGWQRELTFIVRCRGHRLRRNVWLAGPPLPRRAVESTLHDPTHGRRCPTNT